MAEPRRRPAGDLLASPGEPAEPEPTAGPTVAPTAEPTAGPAAGDLLATPMVTEAPSRFVEMPPRTVPTPSGEAALPYKRQEMGRVLAAGRKVGGETQRTADVAALHAGAPVAYDVSPYKIAKRLAGEALDHLPYALEWLDVPSRYLWRGAFWAGQALPDDSDLLREAAAEGALLGGRLGDLTADAVVGLGLGQVGLGMAATGKGPEAVKLAQVAMERTMQENPQAYEEEYRNAGRALYDAISQGALYEMGTEKRNPVEILWGWSTPDVRAHELLDTMYPKERTRRMRDAAPSLGQKVLWDALSTDTGRLLYSSVIDAVFDPINLLGVGSGSKVVSVGKESYRVTPLVLRAGEALNVAEGTDGLAGARKVVDALVRDPRGVADVFQKAAETLTERTARARAIAHEVRTWFGSPGKVREVAAQSLAEAETALATLTANAAAGEAATAGEVVAAGEKVSGLRRWLAALGTTEESAANAVRRVSQAATAEAMKAGQAEDALNTLRRASSSWIGRAGHVQPAGWVNLSLPLGLAGSRTMALSAPFSRPIVRQLGRAADFARGYTPAALAARVKGLPIERIPAALSPGELLAWNVYRMGEDLPVVAGKIDIGAFVKGAKNVASWALDMPQVGWSILGRALGPRTFVAGAVDFGKARPLHELTGAAPLPGRAMFGGDRWRWVPKPMRQAWQEYHERVGRFMQALDAGGQEVLHAVTRILRASQQVYNANAGMLRKAHKTVQDVLDEAVDFYERGTGRLAGDLAHLNPVIDELRIFTEAVAGVLGRPLDQVRQALQVITRKALGDPETFDGLVRALAATDELWRHLAGTVDGVWGEKFDRTVRTWLAGSTALRAVMEAVSPEALAAALEGVTAALRGRALSPVERAAVARRALANLLGGKAAVHRVIDALAQAMGTATDEAVLALRAMVESRAAHGAPLAKAIRQVAAEIEADLAIARQALQTGAVPAVAMGALHRALSAKAARAIAAARGLVGPGWADFQKWADAVLTTETRLRFAPDPEAATALQRLVAAGKPAWARALDHWRTARASLVGSISAAEAAKAILENAAPDAAVRLFNAGLETRLRAILPHLPAGGEAAGDLLAAVRTGETGMIPAGAFAARVAAQKAHEAIASGAVAARPRLPDVPSAAALAGGRTLEAWEADLWRAARVMTADLSELDGIYATLGVLQDAALLPKDLDGVAQWAHRYATPGAVGGLGNPGELLGRRLGDARPDLAPIIEHLSAILKKYEELYRTHGIVRVAEPLEMARDWGVIEHVPHIERAASLVARRKSAAALNALGEAQRPREGATVDEILSTDIAARRRRKIAGTIAEINANPSTPIRMAADPMLILSRLAQANRAVHAQEFLFSLVRGGVIEVVRTVRGGLSAVEQAAARGLVPIFRRGEFARSWDVLLRGTRGELAKAGITASEARAALRSLRDRPKGGFATWMREIPLVQQTEDIEEMALSIRAADLDVGGGNLDAVLERVEELRTRRSEGGAGMGVVQAWRQVADEFNRFAVEVGSDRKTSGDALRAYFAADGGLPEMFVPAHVAQSLDDLFDLEKHIPRGAVRHAKAVADAISRFFKLRFTVIVNAFHTRNAVYNQLSNILDLGVFGAFNPRTLYHATMLPMAAHYVDTFGTLTRAQRDLRAGRRAGESAYAYAKRKMSYAYGFRATGIEAALERGIDLGDGVTRPLDDVVGELTRRGVLTGAYTAFADLAIIQHELADILATGSAGDVGVATKRVLGALEDAAVQVVSLPMTGGVPVAMPKNMGRAVASMIENVGRAINFIGNLRRGTTWDDAAIHVGKYLFNYNDLNAFQKVWMRTLIPFWTWPSKNLWLHMDTLLDSPRVFQWYNQLLLDDGPAIMEAAAQEAEGEPATLRRQDDPDRLRWRDPHTRGRIAVAVPGYHNIYVQGLGTPLEAAFDLGGQVRALVTPRKWRDFVLDGDLDVFRINAIGHFTVRNMLELGSGYNYWRRRRIDELNDAHTIAQVLAGLRRWSDVPVVGGIAEWLTQSLTINTHYYEVHDVDPRSGLLRVHPIAGRPRANYVFNSANPWSRVLLTAAAASDAYHISFLASDEGFPDVSPMPPWMRYLDAETSISFIQEDEAYQRARREREVKRAVVEEAARHGELRPLSIPTVP